MMNDEQLLIQLRDCFTGGYTLPQFCIDNKIRKPLFVAEKKFWAFMWEIYVQFRYDKQLPAQFALIDAPTTEIKFSVHYIIGELICLNISMINPKFFDAVICLTARRIFDNRAIYLDALADYFINKTYIETPLLDFLQRHPQVKLFTTKLPNDIKRYEGGKEFGKTLTETNALAKQIMNSTGNKIPTPLDKFGYTNQEVLEMIYPSKGTKTNFDGTTIIEDNAHPLIQFKNGKRVTAYQLAHFKNRIYFVGPCHYLGSYAPFNKTIESYLQKLLNEKNLPYCVENVSQFCYGRTQDIFYNLNKLTPAPDDIIFVVVENQRATDYNIPFCDVADAFDAPHDYRELFFDNVHANELGYKILAEKYFAFLTAHDFFRNVEFKYATPPPNASVRYPATVRGWQCEYQRGT